MKLNKKLFLLCIVCLCFAHAFAYNPAVGGESLYLLGSPEGLGGGLFSVNTPITFVTAENLAINPALAAAEQRIVVNGSFSALVDAAGNPFLGEAGQIGAIFPTKYGVFSGSLFVANSRLESYDFGTNVTVRGAFSKDISDKLFVGADLNVAFGSGLGAGLGLGFNYAIGSISWLPIFKEVNLSCAINSLGLGYKNAKSQSGLYGGNVSAIPSIVTPRFGFSGVFFSSKNIKAVQILELTTPSFMNAILASGTQVLIANTVSVKVYTELNLRELIAKKASPIPSVSISAKFGINTKDDSFLAKNGWQQSEVLVSGGYRYLYDDVHAVSAGFAGFLGLKDASAPEITLW